jgi:hypothetical protein
MQEHRYRSKALKKMPDRLVLIDFHNWAGVGGKMETALKLRFEVIRLKTNSPPDIVKQAYEHPESTLVILMDPGLPVYQPERPFWRFLARNISGVERSTEIPWGLFWGSSLYRVVNLGYPLSIEEWLKQRRDWFNTLTPLRMVGTEDLMCVEPSRKYRRGKNVQFVGQPYPFPGECPPKNIQHKVIHISSKDNMKGTEKIQKAFEEINVYNEVVRGVSNDVVMEKLKGSTILALTMTDFPSGTGYAGIEALSAGCLVISKKPSFIETPIIHAETPDEMARLVSYYSNNMEEYETVRQAQFKWAKETFSNEAVADRIYDVIDGEIKKGWKP